MNKKIVTFGVIWCCPVCGAYNLNPLNWEEFECINCEAIIYALAANRVEKK